MLCNFALPLAQIEYRRPEVDWVSQTDLFFSKEYPGKILAKDYRPLISVSCHEIAVSCGITLEMHIYMFARLLLRLPIHCIIEQLKEIGQHGIALDSLPLLNIIIYIWSHEGGLLEADDPYYPLEPHPQLKV